MYVPGRKFLQARQGVSTGGQTNQGLSTPVERLLRSPSRRTVSAGSPSETSSRRTASAGSSPGNPFRRTVSAGSPPEISSRRTLSAGSSPGSRFRRTVSAGNPSQDIHSMPAKECAARLMCSAAGTSGLKVCIPQLSTPPCAGLEKFAPRDAHTQLMPEDARPGRNLCHAPTAPVPLDIGPNRGYL